MASSPDTRPEYGVRVTRHAKRRWAERMPNSAIDVREAVRRSARVPGLENHPKFSEHSEYDTDAVYGYHGITTTGDSYVAVLVVVRDGGRPVVVTTYPPLAGDVRGRVVTAIDEAGGTVDETEYSALTNSTTSDTNE